MYTCDLLFNTSEAYVQSNLDRWLLIRVTRRVLLVKQKLVTLPSTIVSLWGSCCSIFSFIRSVCRILLVFLSFWQMYCLYLLRFTAYYNQSWSWTWDATISPPKVHIFKSETRPSEFLIKEIVNPRTELSILTLWTSTNYFSRIIRQKNLQIVISTWKWPPLEKNILHLSYAV